MIEMHIPDVATAGIIWTQTFPECLAKILVVQVADSIFDEMTSRDFPIAVNGNYRSPGPAWSAATGVVRRVDSKQGIKLFAMLDVRLCVVSRLSFEGIDPQINSSG